MRHATILHYLFYGYGLFWTLVGLRDGRPTLISVMGVGFVAIGAMIHFGMSGLRQPQ